MRLAPEDLKQIRFDIRGLYDMQPELRRVGDLLALLLEETRASHGMRVNPSRPEPSGGSARDAFREAVRHTSPELTPILGTAWGQAGRDPGPRVQHDARGGGFDSNLPPAPAPGDPTPAAPQLREPPPGAVHVEANNDAVVPSERHPPEAWQERTGGEAEVYLNPRVTLTDPALQRWSTFFDWERREPGARYEATRPAVVTSTGSVVRKGMARPL